MSTNSHLGARRAHKKYETSIEGTTHSRKTKIKEFISSLFLRKIEKNKKKRDIMK